MEKSVAIPKDGFDIPFTGRAHHYTQEEIGVVLDVMQNAVPLTQGSHLIAFENKFCKFLGVDHAFAMMNATAALEVAAQVCQFQAGDEVIIPAHTYTSSAYPFIKKGASVVWADIDRETRVVTAETIERCITARTKAVVVVHLYGYGADMPSIMQLCKKHNLLVIEDAAQAIGVRIAGRAVGSFGDFGIFSFHSHKNISTLGEGGMLVVKNEEHASAIPMVRHNGHCSFDFARDKYWLPAMGNVDLPSLNREPLWPNNYCLGEVESALGVKLLDRVDIINREKQNRAIRFIDELSDRPELLFHRVDSERHSYHLLVAEMVRGDRDEFIGRMAQTGVQCVVQYYPLYRYDLYRKAGYGIADCPNTDIFFDNMVSFPFNHMMSEAQLSKMCGLARRCLEEVVC
jgi:perosamine synthetase